MFGQSTEHLQHKRVLS